VHEGVVEGLLERLVLAEELVLYSVVLGQILKLTVHHRQLEVLLKGRDVLQNVLVKHGLF